MQTARRLPSPTGQPITTRAFIIPPHARIQATRTVSLIAVPVCDHVFPASQFPKANQLSVKGTSSSADYIWSCDLSLTKFCCHNPDESLGQFDCCSDGTFSLPSPRILGGQVSQTASSSIPSSTPSGTSTSTSTSTSKTAQSTISTAPPDQKSSPLPPTDTAASKSSGLSTGAKAGIGVGVAVGAIIVIVLGILFYRAHRKKHPTAELSAATPSGQPTSEIDGRSVVARQMIPQQLGGKPMSELSSGVKEDTTPTYELGT